MSIKPFLNGNFNIFIVTLKMWLDVLILFSGTHYGQKLRKLHKLIFLENAKKCKDWEKWYSFGTMLALKEQSLKFNNFPTKEEYVNSRKFNLDTDNDKLLTDLTKEVGEVFYDVTSHFLKLYPEESLSNYVKNSASVNKYLDNQGITKNYAMTYHTDRKSVV